METDRLKLRQWCDDDIAPFCAMNCSDAVMKFFPRHYSEEESTAFVQGAIEHIDQRGWGNWAVEIPGICRFAGFVGLSSPADWHPCAGNVEIGWRLDSRYWKQGYATEAASEVLGFAFGKLAIQEVVSFTAKSNTPSIAVMQRIGLRWNGETFEHPRIAEDDPLRHHVVYRLSRELYHAGTGMQ